MSKRICSLVTTAVLVAVAVLVASPPHAGAAPTRARTITVVGTGQVRGTPDVADLTIGVSGRGETAAGVLGTIADRAQKVIDVMREAGVAEDDIQTRDLSVQPVFDDDGRVVGYEATNTVVARIRDLSKAGGVVDAAAERAGDTIRVQGITFSIDDDSKLLAAARTQATKRARAQAQELASGAGVEVGEVRSIEESTTSLPVSFSEGAARDAASTPVMPGSAVLSVSATVVFAIA
jgi:hypothetical protein